MVAETEHYYTVSIQDAYSPLVETVHALYVVEEESYTVFKDMAHKMSAQYRTELVIGIKRGSVYVADRA